MDDVFISHALLWIVGGMTLLATVLSIGASLAMGRSSYRKD